MSSTAIEERATDAVARCKRQPSGIYAPAIYSGIQREALYADERGAACVVELAFGGRLAIYSDSATQMRVITLSERP